MIRVISLGAGVQSTTMALMAAHGELGPMPDCAIFADTGWEPKAVYDHLAWLMSANVLPFPVHVVTNGNIRNNIVAASHGMRWSTIPAFVPDDNAPPIARQCTRDFKITPIRRKVREMVGLTGKQSPKAPVVELWIGISLDEVMRVRHSRETWQANRYPLIDQRLSRGDCLEWLKRHDYPIPGKSACIGCPYHDNAAWRALKDNSPTEWADAVAIDAAIRTGVRGMKRELFLHRDCVPLAEVDLSTAEDHGQLNLFNNECEGMCGV